MAKDRIYTTPKDSVAPFVFDEGVADVFTDMVNRSVPGYGMMLEMIGVITRHYAQPGTNCYDLGCSLGASTLAIRRNLPYDNCTVIAVDNAPAMIEKCTANINADPSLAQVDIRCEDISSTAITNASLAVMNFTLQFIKTEQRPALLRNIAEGLRPGGLLVLSEKIQLAEAGTDNKLTELHHDFKKSRGYSDLEIAQKRSALENVLLPDTLATHTARLKSSGFSQVIPWFQCFNFFSILAFK